MGFTKLHGEMLYSTVWRAEDDKTRIVWVTFLLLTNRKGEVMASIPGLADAAKVSIEDCQKAVERLKSPDKYSRSKEFDGRRIAEIEGGWQILNYIKYRDKCRGEDRREYLREKQAEYRARQKTPQKPSQSSISPTIQQVKDECFKQGLADNDAEKIYAHYTKKSWLDGNQTPITNLAACIMQWRLNKPEYNAKKQNGNPPKQTAEEIAKEFEEMMNKEKK